MQNKKSYYNQSSLLRMNLQMFADDPEPNPEPGNPAPEPVPEPKPGEKKYTDEDVNNIINRKFAEWEKKQEKEKKKKSEAEKLKEMNDQQKADYEREQLEKKVEELMKKETLSQMSRSARGMLQEKGINVSDQLLSMLISEDADTTKASVDSFISLFQAEVGKAVKEALKGETPRTGGASGMTKEQIMAVTNRAERQRLIKENINLFR